LIEELKHQKIRICAIQEIKRKGKSQEIYGDYLVCYTGIDHGESTKAGISDKCIVIHNRYIDET